MTPGAAMPPADPTSLTSAAISPPDVATLSPRAALLAALDDAIRQGLLRPIDTALARLVARHDTQAPTALLAAAAWCSRAAGDGHLCLDFRALPSLLASAALSAAAAPAARGGPAPDALAWRAWLPSSPADAEAAFAAAGVSLGRPDAGADTGADTPPPLAPLVFSAGRLYLGRHWHAEQRIAVLASRMAADAPAHGGPPDAEVQALLNRLFAGQDGDASAAQRQACARAAARRLTLITGGPGTGKTYTAARVLALLAALHTGPRPLRVVMAAPTGKAAARLRESVDTAWASLRRQCPGLPWDRRDITSRLQVGTLHRLLGLPVGGGPPVQAWPGLLGSGAGTHHALRADVVVVDEASMIAADMRLALLQAVPPTARLILLGDADQLASVEAGSILADLAQGAPPGSGLARQTVHLTHSHRFGGAIGQLARAVRQAEAAAVEALLTAHEGAAATAELSWTAVPATRAGHLAEQALQQGDTPTHASWMQQLRQVPASDTAFAAWVAAMLHAFQRFRVLCALREGPWGVAGLNEAIETAAAQRGWLRPSAQGYEGRAVMVTQNDTGLQLFNGDTGLVLRARPGSLREVGLAAWFAGPHGPRAVALSRLPAVETALAMTVHKSQGSEFEHAMLVLPWGEHPVLTRELLYTGVTRAKSRLSLSAPDLSAVLQALPRRTLRHSGLREALRQVAAAPPV
ncbi:MAG: exodeoxyribonuclease V subunit alpha [Rubrivivax sp.]